MVAIGTQAGQRYAAAPGALRPEPILLRLNLGITDWIFGSDIVSWHKKDSLQFKTVLPRPAQYGQEHTDLSNHSVSKVQAALVGWRGQLWIPPGFLPLLQMPDTLWAQIYGLTYGFWGPIPLLPSISPIDPAALKWQLSAY